MTNRQHTIIEEVRKLYLIYFDPGADELDKILIAIKSIESYNRRIIWRICEYLCVIVLSILYLFRKNISNLSIGKFQLKLTYILDYLGIKYKLYGRKIFLPTMAFPLKMVLQFSNNIAVIRFIAQSEKFNFFVNNTLDWNKLKFFVEEYSRNLPFDEGFNYFTVLKNVLLVDIDYI